MQSIPDSFRDLLTAEFATLATVGRYGGPHQSIVWFLAEGDVVKLSLNSSRQKTDNLLRNPACSLLITDPKNSYRYLELRGQAKIEPDPDYAFADKVGAKYGADIRDNDLAGDKRFAVTVQVDRARGYPAGGD
jgi:PPOX class probable F420-dependent enzyme